MEAIQYCGGIAAILRGIAAVLRGIAAVLRGDSISTCGGIASGLWRDSISTVEAVQYCGG